MDEDLTPCAVTDMDIDGSKSGSSPRSAIVSRLRNSVHGLRRNPFKLAAAGLGLLCVFLLAGIIAQNLHYRKLERESENRLSTVTKVRDYLQENLNTSQANHDTLVKVNDDLQANYTALLQEKHQLRSSKRSITTERDRLQQEVQRLNAVFEEKACPAGWKTFQCNCYFAASVNKTWVDSRADCQSKGADLVIITSEEEMTFINGLYSSDSEPWIGLTDEGEEGHWVWVDGTLLNRTFWAPGQPNSFEGRNQDCVEFWHRSTRQGEWNDENCNVATQWICEK